VTATLATADTVVTATMAAAVESVEEPMRNIRRQDDCDDQERVGGLANDE
jgi:hypothetical protein